MSAVLGGNHYNRFGKNFEKLEYFNGIKIKILQILEKWLRILKILGRRLYEKFQEISEKLWC